MRMLLFLIMLCGAGYGVSDSTMLLFEKGIAAYDTVLIGRALRSAEAQHPDAEYLFKATCFWRIQIIAFIGDDKKETARYGKQALDLLDKAERNREDRYMIYARRAFVTQLLAGTGLKNGATYGPRTSKLLDEMKKMKPDAFETRFIEAVNLLEMPSFVGGDPKKAAKELALLHKRYPDSAAAAISYARALLKIKKQKEARAVLDAVLNANPKDIWARKVRDGR
ncbi:MAG: tetratricopeptide repeat protein [Chitinispirillaceae bacterium]|nr:tetratricopeptide repeat protein [Chitinispirillaceae bacterium]